MNKIKPGYVVEFNNKNYSKWLGKRFSFLKYEGYFVECICLKDYTDIGYSKGTCCVFDPLDIKLVSPTSTSRMPSWL